MSAKLKIATRKSALAMWQANHVHALLKRNWPDLEVELLPVVTEGDRILDKPLATIGGKGLFLKELETALLNGEADLAVHSMKDIPAGETEGLVLASVLPRANPFDALVKPAGASQEELPEGSTVGTSSLRRQSQLLATRPDLQVADLRGNVDTRLRKLDEGQYDAIILACAGLERLGLGDRISKQLTPPAWLPASTQGIICLQCRDGDSETGSRLRALNHAPTSILARAERMVAQRLEGSCQLPLAVFADLALDLQVQAMVATPDGSTIVRASASGDPSRPEELGEAVAENLLSKGAGEIIQALR